MNGPDLKLEVLQFIHAYANMPQRQFRERWPEWWQRLAQRQEIHGASTGANDIFCELAGEALATEPSPSEIEHLAESRVGMENTDDRC